MPPTPRKGRHTAPVLVVLLLLAGLVPAGRALAADPKPPSLKKTLAHVLPDKRDLAWTKVAWEATLWDAVIKAHAEKKPILLWAMNGHALACT